MSKAAAELPKGSTESTRIERSTVGSGSKP
jgi:hypothetical protein